MALSQQRIAAPAVRIRIGKQDRVAIFGTTGSGKSYRAMHLLAGYPRVAVLDPKFDFDLPGAVEVGRYDPKLKKQVFRPYEKRPINEQTEDFLDQLWQYRLPGIVYADEVNDLSSGPRSFSPAWNRIIRQGRRLGVCAWSASQRPTDVPSTIFTESQHFFIFALAWENDRKKVESFTGDDVARLVDGLQEFECVYYDKRTRTGRVLPPAIPSVVTAGGPIAPTHANRPGGLAGWFDRLTQR